jgi:hypothetical protein
MILFAMDKYAKPAVVFSLLMLALLAVRPAFAQDAPPPPRPPYVGSLTGDFSLTKRFTYTAAGTLSPEEKATQGDPTNPVQVDMEKKGAIRKDTEHFLDGSGRITWRSGVYRFIVDAQHPDSVNLDMAGNPNDTQNIRYHDPGDFPELSWIVSNTYSGTQNQQGKVCYLYKLGDESAVIDASTRLPLSFQSKTVQVTYTYSGAPDETLQLPKGYAEKLVKFQRALRGQF